LLFFTGPGSTGLLAMLAMRAMSITNKFSQSTDQAVDAISQDVPGAGNTPAIRMDYTLFSARTQAGPAVFVSL
jgi:hypothetical protein